MEVSVVICTHNPHRQRLDRTLAALRAQTLPTGKWELLVIDNASAPPVAVDLGWHPAARIVRESRLGLTAARLRGIADGRGELIVFVDDDNILAPDYLAEADRISNAWPILGAWGGRIDPEFEAAPPEWTQPFWPMLAIVPLEKPRWSNACTNNHAIPLGAGQCVRQAVARHYARLVETDPLRRSLDRVGDTLTSCGDIDLALTSIALGLGTGQFPSLKVTHIIPAKRLEQDYLLRLIEGVAYSSHLLDALHGSPPRRRPYSRLRQWIERREGRRQPARDQAIAQAYQRALHRALDTLERIQRPPLEGPPTPWPT